MRVRVKSGDGAIDLGLGTLVGYVTVYALWHPSSILRSDKLAEQKPSDKYVEAYEKLGGELVEIPNNPKIKLDSGRIVYGCQVWWSEVVKE